MVDSINFNVKNVLREDIRIPKNVEVKDFVNDNVSNKYLRNGYQFYYKNIGFYYYPNVSILLIVANAHKVLDKQDVCLSDLKEYKAKIQDIVSEVINLNKHIYKLSRFDFCVDIKFQDEETMYQYLRILSFARDTYQHLQRMESYESSKYLKTKRGKHNLNIYDRYSKSRKEKDRGILRIELQCKKSFIKSSKLKTLEELWTKEAMEDIYFNFFEGYLYTGDYYTFECATDIVDKSSFTALKKEQLKHFLEESKKYGLAELFKNSQTHKYSVNMLENRIEKLSTLGINPIIIPDTFGVEHLPSLITLARHTAEQKYFKK